MWTTVGVMLGLGLMLAPVALTCVGARRRGSRLASAAVAGLFFPVTWTVWYLRDEHPYSNERA